jgi:hypothetical protein|tara:strand:- start:543 stop:758 length:216 start_codon:yes stop_codon:yes gene_type:complete
MSNKITFMEKEIKNKMVRIKWNSTTLKSVGTYIDDEERPFLFTTSRVEIGPNTAYDIAEAHLKAVEDLLLI